jgi:hypothetical protein
MVEMLGLIGQGRSGGGMADYRPLIEKAVAGLKDNAPEARRKLYERARIALAEQLRGVTPPLSESEITRERLALEEAIRRVELSASRPPAALAPLPSRKPVAESPQQIERAKPAFQATQRPRTTGSRDDPGPWGASDHAAGIPAHRAAPATPASDSTQAAVERMVLAAADAPDIISLKMLSTYVVGLAVGIPFIVSAYGQDFPKNPMWAGTIRELGEVINSFNNIVSYRSLIFIAVGCLVSAILLSRWNGDFIAYVRGFFFGFGFYPLIIMAGGVIVAALFLVYFGYLAFLYLGYAFAYLLELIFYYPMMLLIYLGKLVAQLVGALLSILFEILKPVLVLIWTIIGPVVLAIWSMMSFIFGILGTVLMAIWTYVLSPLFSYGGWLLLIALAALVALAILWPVSALGRATTDSFLSVLRIRTHRVCQFGQGFTLGIAIFAVAGALLLRGHDIDHHAPVAEMIICALFGFHVLIALSILGRPAGKATFFEDIRLFWKQESQERTGQLALFPVFAVLSVMAISAEGESH